MNPKYAEQNLAVIRQSALNSLRMEQATKKNQLKARTILRGFG